MEKILRDDGDGYERRYEEEEEEEEEEGALVAASTSTASSCFCRIPRSFSQDHCAKVWIGVGERAKHDGAPYIYILS